MAIYSCHAGVFTRSKGHTSIAAAAYRAGVKLHDPTVGKTEDYRWKNDGIIHSEILAPENAPDWMFDRNRLWAAVEAQEKRSDSQLAREILVALPHELDAVDRLDLVRGFIRDEFVALGMVADFSIHAPSERGDQRNFHCHIMLTMRPIDHDGFAAKKAREWNSKELLQTWREAWAEHTNNALEDAGFDERIDHRSLEDQGVDRQPGEHLGKHATHAERKGRKTLRGDRNRDVEEFNAALADQLEELKALEEEIVAHEEEQLDERYGAPDDDIVIEDDAAAAADEIRELAAQYGLEDLAYGDNEAEGSSLEKLAPFDPAPDAKAAAEQIRTAARPFAEAMRKVGGVPEIISNLVQDGFKWWQRATQHVTDLVGDARDTIRSWRDYAQQERADRNRDDDLDLR